MFVYIEKVANGFILHPLPAKDFPGVNKTVSTPEAATLGKSVVQLFEQMEKAIDKKPHNGSIPESGGKGE